MKKIFSIVLVLAMLLCLVACGGASDKKTLYVLVPTPDHGWTGAVGVAAQEKVDALNEAGDYKVVMKTFASAEDQIKLIEDIIANNPGDGSVGVALLPHGPAVENAIQQLIDAKIPYSAADRIIDSVAPAAVSNVRYDNVEIGAAVAAYLVSNGMVEGDKVVVIEGDTSSASTDRVSGFEKYLKGELALAGSYIETPWTSLDSVSKSGSTEWNGAKAQAYIETYFSNSANANTKYIASMDDGLTLGIFDALEGSGIDESVKDTFFAGKPYITGVGGAQALYDIISGASTKYTCTAEFEGIVSVTYPPAMIQVAIQDMIDYFDGKEVRQNNTQSAQVVNADNVADFKGFE